MIQKELHLRHDPPQRDVAGESEKKPRSFSAIPSAR